MTAAALLARGQRAQRKAAELSQISTQPWTSARQQLDPVKARRWSVFVRLSERYFRQHSRELIATISAC